MQKDNKKNKKKTQELLKNKVIDVLKRVDDPELGIDVYTLGLVYEIKINKSKLYLKMTFTTPLCPYGPMLIDLIESAIKEEIKEIKSVKIDITFEPLWQPSEELKTALGLK